MSKTHKNAKEATLRKIIAGAGVAALAALTLGLAAPAAHAEDPLGLGGIAGFSANQTEVCGASSITPVLVSNYTNLPQTGSITVNSELSLEVGVFTSLDDAMASPWGSANSGFCVDEAGHNSRSNENAISQNFTIPAGGQSLYYLGVGGLGVNIATTSHDIAIGGMATGSSPIQYYNFTVNLNADESFNNLLPYYQGTGGIDPTTNIQGVEGGFNLTQCNVQGSTLYNTTKITSPFSESTAYLPTVGQNQPLCMAWFPEGQYLTNTQIQGSDLVSQVLATQYNPAANTISVAGDFATTNPVAASTAFGGTASTTPIPTSPGSDAGTYYQNGSRFVIENMPIQCENMLLMFTNSAYEPSYLLLQPPSSVECNTYVPNPEDTTFAVTNLATTMPQQGYNISVAPAGSSGASVIANIQANIGIASPGGPSVLGYTTDATGAEYPNVFQANGGGMVLNSITGPNGAITTYNNAPFTMSTNPVTGDTEFNLSVTIPVAQSTTLLQEGQTFPAATYTVNASLTGVVAAMNSPTPGAALPDIPVSFTVVVTPPAAN